MKPITLLLAHSDAAVRSALCALVEANGRFVVVGEAPNGREAVKLAKALWPDVILMDFALPMLSALDATRQVRALRPGAKVLILSAYSEEEYVEGLNKIRLAGSVEKPTGAVKLIEALLEVGQGCSFFSAVAAPRVTGEKVFSPDRKDSLKGKSRLPTAREIEVLRLIAQGQSNKQVAATLNIDVKTVKNHRQRLMNKLDIHDVATLTRYALTSGLVEMVSPESPR